ncbi:MAG: ATP-binding protein [Chloroflexia bacterium]|nr:ATP-binding protein [Chloroflexia bacterium]
MARSRPHPNGVEPAFDPASYVGTLVGGSTSGQFRLAVAHEEIREQDIIAVDATLRRPGSEDTEAIRVWAKVQEIERLNPLFPMESAQELAATRTNPLDTVLSLSREMVTAVCQVLGFEPIGGEGKGGKLGQLRYPPQPATSAYRPTSDDIKRIVVGALGRAEALDVATLANRSDVDVSINGHAVVTRHLAILAMTGAGKSWAARRIIEELARKNYPMVIFDPHGDYSGLADVPALDGRVRRYFAQFPVFEQDAEAVARVVESLSRELAKTHREKFDGLFEAAKRFLGSSAERAERGRWLSDYLNNPTIAKYGIEPNLFFFADFVQAVVTAGKQEDTAALSDLEEWIGAERVADVTFKKQVAGWLEGLPGNLRYAAIRLRSMEQISRRSAATAMPLPSDRTELVDYGRISVVSLAGYSSDFQAAIYSLVAEAIFEARVSGDLNYPALLVLEEAHNFAPGRATTHAETRSIETTKQIAQEGRKFGVGLVLISQRPSRIDETTLSQCNSYLIMRLANPADQNFVRKVIETLGEYEANLLPDLDVGEALLSGQFTNFPILVRMKEPASRGEREEESAFVSLQRAHAAAQSQPGQPQHRS